MSSLFKRRIHPLLLALFTFSVILFLAYFIHADYFRGLMRTQPIGLRGMEAFLKLTLVSHLGVSLSIKVLCVLAVVAGIHVYFRHTKLRLRDSHLSLKKRLLEGESISDLSSSDKQMLKSILAGVNAQLENEDKLADARDNSHPGVRLVPRTSSVSNESIHSWFGGSPVLPDYCDWPLIGDEAAVFIAQIDCAQLPENLWSGLGPREGYLSFFVARNWPPETKVIYATSQGSTREKPNAASPEWFKPGGFHYPTDTPTRTEFQPHWVIDIVTSEKSEADSKKPKVSLYDIGIDLTQRSFQPFDWETTTGLFQTAINHLNGASDRMSSHKEPREREIEGIKETLDSEEEVENKDQLLRRLTNLSNIGHAFETLKQEHSKSVDEISQLLLRAQKLSETTPFSPEILSPLIEDLASISISHLVPAGDDERESDMLATSVKAYPATLFGRYENETARLNSWIWDFEGYRNDAAIETYNKDPAILPPEIRQYYEKKWRSIAEQEAARMLDTPYGFIHDFDIQKEVVLLELPTSKLLYWIWGDMYHLVLTITKTDLSNLEFSNIKFHISN